MFNQKRRAGKVLVQWALLSKGFWCAGVNEGGLDKAH